MTRPAREATPTGPPPPRPTPVPPASTTSGSEHVRTAPAATFHLPQLPVVRRPRRAAGPAAPLRPLARFGTGTTAANRRTTRALPLRSVIDAYLQRSGIDLQGGSIRMLANARVLGHVFNPLSLLLVSRAGALTAPTAGVRDRRGPQHLRRAAPLSAPPGRQRARGRRPPSSSTSRRSTRSRATYSMSLPEPAATPRAAVTLHPPRGAAFVARRARAAVAGPRTCHSRGCCSAGPGRTSRFRRASAGKASSSTCAGFRSSRAPTGNDQ